MLKTAGAESPNVTFSEVAFSIGMFVVLYAIVFAMFISLLNRMIQQGPPEPEEEGASESLPDSFGEIFRHRSRVSSRGD